MWKPSASCLAHERRRGRTWRVKSQRDEESGMKQVGGQKQQHVFYTITIYSADGNVGHSAHHDDHRRDNIVRMIPIGPSLLLPPLPFGAHSLFAFSAVRLPL